MLLLLKDLPEDALRLDLLKEGALRALLLLWSPRVVLWLWRRMRKMHPCKVMMATSQTQAVLRQRQSLWIGLKMKRQHPLLLELRRCLSLLHLQAFPH